MKRLLALLVCAALLLTLLAGCGRKNGDANGPAIAEQPLVTDPDANVSVGRGGTGFATYAPDTVVGEVNGSEVTWMEYYYWLTYYARLFIDRSIENDIALSSWDAVGEMSMDMSNAEVVVTATQFMTKYYHAILTGTDGLDIRLSERDRAELEEIYESYQDEDGDGTVSEEEAAAYEEYLAGQCVDKDFLLYLLEVAKLTELTFDTLYGESGEKYADEDVMAFIADNGYMSAKRIAILTVDAETGAALDEETVAEKSALAERLHEELAAAEDTDELIELFDEYMYEYSADYNPDGYVFMNDGSPLTTITAKLDENYGLSEAERTSYGYEIVLRQPVQPDTVAETDADGSAYTIRYLAAEWGQQLLVNSWSETADVTWNKGFEAPDLQAIFG